MQTLKTYIKDWKWWFKLSVGVIPLISIIVFFIGQSVDVLSDSAAFWTRDFDGRTEDFTPELMERVQAWSKGQNFGYLIARNVFMYTTLANVAWSAFLINSAVHHRYEGVGKFDNYQVGIIIGCQIMWVIICYNGSLLFSGAFNDMVWYNYLSWICEHSLIPFLGIIYLLFFYKKPDIHAKGNKHWFRLKLMGYSLLPLFIYHFIFIALGFILKAADTFPLFGDMSSTGYFPYEYMDFSNSNTRIHADWLAPWSQFLLIMLLFLIEQIAVFFILYGICQANKKHQNH